MRYLATLITAYSGKLLLLFLLILPVPYQHTSYYPISILHTTISAYFIHHATYYRTTVSPCYCNNAKLHHCIIVPPYHQKLINVFKMCLNNWTDRPKRTRDELHLQSPIQSIILRGVSLFMLSFTYICSFLSPWFGSPRNRSLNWPTIPIVHTNIYSIVLSAIKELINWQNDMPMAFLISTSWFMW